MLLPIFKPTMKAKLLPLLFVFFFTIDKGYAQTIIEIIAPVYDNSTTTGRAPNGTTSHTTFRGHFIIPASELSDIPVGSPLSSIGFSYVSGSGSLPAGGQIKFYLQNTPDNTNLKSATWATAISDMNQVYNGTFNLPLGAAPAQSSVNLSTPFTYTGGGVYVAYDYLGTNFSNVAAIFRANSGGVTGGIRNGASTTTTPPSTLDNAASFRPEMIIGYNNPLQNDFSLAKLSSYGYYNPNATNQNVVIATVKNNGNAARGNVNVQLTVTGANPQTLNQVISAVIGAGQSTDVTFILSGTNNGTQQIQVTVPNDEKNSNNSNHKSQSINCSTLRYVGNETANTGVGFATATGIIMARYTTENLAINVNAVKLHISDNASAVGKALKGVILDLNGNVIATSQDYTIIAADLNNDVTIPFDVAQTIGANTAFHVGAIQTSSTTAYYPFGTAMSTAYTLKQYFTSANTGGSLTPITDLGNIAIGFESSTTIALTNTAPGVIEYGQQVTLNATAGFTSYNFKVNGISKQNTASATFTYSAINNDVVVVEGLKSGCSTLSNSLTMQTTEVVPTGGVLFVKKGSSGNGSSWNNALGELADALLAAKVNLTITQIWLSGGTYKPLYSPEDGIGFGTNKGRGNAFLLVKNVKIYGGFDPDNGQIDLASRNPLQVTTILSGDIDNNDVLTNGVSTTLNGANAYHVLISADDVGTAELQGLTITAGLANGFSAFTTNGKLISNLNGAGMFNHTSSPGVNQVNFSGNTASITLDGSGGGMYNRVSSNPTITNSLFSGNAASVGGGICNDNSSPDIINTLFSGNTAIGLGGGMANIVANPVSINSVFSGNNSPSGGGIFNTNNASPKFYNSIIYNNNSGVTNADVSSVPEYANSLVQGSPSGANMINYTGDVSNIFVNPLAPGLSIGGDYNLKLGSPAIDAGNTSLFTGLNASTLDLAGNSRLKGNAIDLGAYELQTQPQIITVGNLVKTYGEADFEPGATASSGLPVSYVSADNSIAEVYQDVADLNKWKLKIKKAGTVQITAKQIGGNVSGNIYDAAIDVPFTLTINKKPVTLILTGSVTKIYDGTTNASVGLVNLAFAANSIVGTDQLSISLSSTLGSYDTKDVATTKTVSLALANASIAGTHVGNYSIANTQAITANIGLISARAVTITADAKSKTYGDADPVFTYAVNPVLATGDSFTGSLARVVGENIGVYTIMQGSLALNGNYAVTYVDNQLTIGQKNIIVTATAKNKIYGNADPVLNYTFAPALATGDSFTGALTRATGENVGSYIINQGNLALNSNYVLSYTSNNLIITKRTVTVTAENKLKIYGDSDPELTYVVTGLFGGDVINGVLEREAGESVGIYQINNNALNAGANYNLTYVAAILTINPKKLTITAVAKSKLYGELDPVLTYITSGLFGGDMISGALERELGEHVGSYQINKGTLQAGTNYELNYISSRLTINPKKVIITVASKNKIYGDQDPTLTYTALGLSGGDVINGILSRAQGERVGNYAILQGTLTISSNYQLEFLSSNLTISPKEITVTADAKSKTYGESDPMLSYTFSPALVIGDNFSGSLGRAPGENAGTYTITQATLSAGDNYTISYKSALLTVNKAVLMVTATNAQLCQGTNLPVFAVSYTGFKGNDNESSLSNKPNVSTTATSSSTAGNYVLSPLGGISGNYSFSYNTGVLTINALPQLTLTSSTGTVTEISLGKTIKLSASGGVSYAWRDGSGVIAGQNDAELTVRPTGTTTYTVIATNASGCTKEQTITFTVKNDFETIAATNLMTPNGDGINDFWVVENIDLYPNNEVRIFDRAGRVLYRKRTYDNSWDGTVNGNPLAEGTYYYIIDFGKDKPVRKGFITIVTATKK